MTAGWTVPNKPNRGKRAGRVAAQPDFTHSPLAIGKVRTWDDLTYVHAAQGGGFTVAEFQQIPDERAELLDGVVVVRPELTLAERQIIQDLYKELCDRCPKGLTPFCGQRGVQVGPASVFRPDLQMVPGDGVGTLPALVVELRPDRGPHYRSDERRAKLHGYRDAGIGSYWVVNHDTRSVAVYDTQYIKKGSYGCDQVCGRGQRYWWRMWARWS